MEWISVEDRFPDEGEMVLVFSEKGTFHGYKMDVDYIVDLPTEIIWARQTDQSCITHWKRLPLGPNEKKEN